MSHIISLNIIRQQTNEDIADTNKTVNMMIINNQGTSVPIENVERFPGTVKTIPIAPNNDMVYTIFDQFMKNPSLIRLGQNEKVVTRRLVSLFNEVTKQNISLNSKFPKLMGQFIINNPQYGIVKKSRTEGIMYLGVGLVTDQEPKIKRPLADTYVEIKANYKEKNNIRAIRKRSDMDNMKQEIQLRTQWTDIEYQRMVNMGFIPAIKNDNLINIDAILEIARANIIAYTYNEIHKIKRSVRGANSVKRAFEDAIRQDEYLSILHSFPTYTNRLRVVHDVTNTWNSLATDIKRYNNAITDLPKINHIVYPDIQHINSILEWLKSHNAHGTNKDMALTQYVAEPTITSDPLIEWNIHDTVIDHSETMIFLV